MKKMNDDFDAKNVLKSVFSEHWSKALLVEPDQKRRWTYGEVLRRAFAVDDWLKGAGYDDEEPIYFAPSNSSAPLVIFLGALLSNRKIYVIDPSRGEQDVSEMLSIVEGERLLTDNPSILERDNAIQLQSIEPADLSKTEVLNQFSAIDVTKPFLVTFTSGTTGTPKGVVHSFENLARASLRFGDRFEFSPQDTFYHTLPMGYMAGILNGLLLPLCHGSTIVVGKRITAATAAAFFESVDTFDVNVFWLTPTILRMLLHLCPGSYDGGDSAIGCVATEPLPTDLKREFESEFGINLFETYGLSETLFITTEFPSQEGTPDGVGPALPEVDLTVEDDGEIVVDAPWTFLNYADGKERTGGGDVYHTGDIGEIRDGVVYITGRKKNLIIRNGINISPKRIEDKMSSMDAVSSVAVIGRDSAALGEQVIVLVEPDGDAPSEQELEHRVITELGSDHRPDEIALVDEIPRTNAGDIDYDAAREIFG